MPRDTTGVPARIALRDVSNDNRNVDPHGVMHAVLDDRAAPDPGHSAQDCLLGWLLDLPAELDPAIAARQLLAARPAKSASARAHRVAELLAETEAHPRSRRVAGRTGDRSAKP